MDIFTLKENDTLPVLSVTLKNPDKSVFDLSNADNVYLHITLSDGTELTDRDMVIDGDPTTGIVTYPWVAADWNAGQLVVSPTPPTPSAPDHKMEYEVVGPGLGRLTFPNGGYDTLEIPADIGQGT